jgi:nucleotide-binding universal stress UspA family protein
LSTYVDAEIHVLHVKDPQEWSNADDVEGFELVAHERSQEATETVFDRAGEITQNYENEITTEMVSGEAATSIVNYAEEHGVDHIVLGSHGRHGLSRYFLGSVAERVVRQAHVPVTIIRENPSTQET